MTIQTNDQWCVEQHPQRGFHVKMLRDILLRNRMSMTGDAPASEYRVVDIHPDRIAAMEACKQFKKTWKQEHDNKGANNA